jgi:hypothetical protein
MSDLIERLRTADNEELWACANEAADALEAKDADIARLRAALKEIAFKDRTGARTGSWFDRWSALTEIARKALEGKL